LSLRRLRACSLLLLHHRLTLRRLRASGLLLLLHHRLTLRRLRASGLLLLSCSRCSHSFLLFHRPLLLLTRCRLLTSGVLLSALNPSLLVGLIRALLLLLNRSLRRLSLRWPLAFLLPLLLLLLLLLTLLLLLLTHLLLLRLASGRLLLSTHARLFLHLRLALLLLLDLVSPLLLLNRRVGLALEPLLLFLLLTHLLLLLLLLRGLLLRCSRLLLTLCLELVPHLLPHLLLLGSRVCSGLHGWRTSRPRRDTAILFEPLRILRWSSLRHDRRLRQAVWTTSSYRLRRLIDLQLVLLSIGGHGVHLK
jgi:hypothetical protein